MRPIYYFLFFLSSFHILAETCGPVDFRKSQFKDLPVENQAMGTCYSYSASQLIDGFLSKNDKLKKHHHTFGIPAAFLDHDNWYMNLYSSVRKGEMSDFIRGGFTCDTANEIIKKGACDYDDMVKKMNQQVFKRDYAGDDEVTIIAYLANLNKMYNFIKNENEKFEQYRSCDCGNCSWKMRSELRSIFGPSYNDILKVLKGTIDDDSMFSFAGSFMYEECKKNLTKVEGIECVTGSTVNQEITEKNIFGANQAKKSGLQILNEQLDNGNSVGIRYCERLLKYGKDFDGLNFLGIGKWGEKGCGVHASVVIGRRKNKGKCQVLIRNSYGKGCGYSSDWECHDGEIWVDQDALDRNLMEVNFLRKKR